jgi:hypothetical protein
MNRNLLPCAIICSVLGLSMPEGGLQAEEPPAQVEGRAHFKRGVDFFKEGDYRGAMIEFKRAYELAPNYKVLYNLGQTSLELQDYASALRSFERYLADGGKDILAPRRTQIEGEIEKLKKRVARVEIATSVPDAEVFVDDVSVGRTPLSAAVAVSAGRRKISALKGGLTAMRVIDIAGGDSTTVMLEIVEPVLAPSAAVGVAGSRTPETGAVPRSPEGMRASAGPSAIESSRNTGLWIGITVTGALAAGTIATGIFALRAKKDFDNTVARYGVEPQAVTDARQKTRTLALVTDIFGGATVVAGGITLIAALASGGPSKESTQAVRVDITPSGLLASGTF